MKELQKQKFIFFIALIIIISAAIIIKKEKSSQQSPYRLAKLPNFRSVDIKGSDVKKADFEGKNLYIQFINSLFPPNLSLFETVYNNWASEDICFMGILSDSSIVGYLEKF